MMPKELFVVGGTWAARRSRYRQIPAKKRRPRSLQV